MANSTVLPAIALTTAKTPAAIANLPEVYLMGARLHAITERQCVDLVLDAIDTACGGSINTMNLDHLRRFVQNGDCACLHSHASIVTADGMPLIWASVLKGTPLPERVTGSNLIWSLSASAARRGRSIFLLGGAPGTAQKAAACLARRYPDLRIAGFSSQPDEFGAERGQWNSLAQTLAAARPDIVYVALGSPKQEELIETLRDTLTASWWLGVGIAFSFVAGEIPRAPLWMQRAGLEWFHRLLKEPRRLARRYLIQGLPFAVRLFRESALQRMRSSREPRCDRSRSTPDG